MINGSGRPAASFGLAPPPQPYHTGEISQADMRFDFLVVVADQVRTHAHLQGQPFLYYCGAPHVRD